MQGRGVEEAHLWCLRAVDFNVSVCVRGSGLPPLTQPHAAGYAGRLCDGGHVLTGSFLLQALGGEGPRQPASRL